MNCMTLFYNGSTNKRKKLEYNLLRLKDQKTKLQNAYKLLSYIFWCCNKQIINWKINAFACYIRIKHRNKSLVSFCHCYFL